jgi:hypothetical protein
MVGADLAATDPETLALLTNPEVLAVAREGHEPREVYRDGDAIAWTAAAPPAGSYLAVVHTGDRPAELELAWPALGMSHPHRLRDLWRRAPLPTSDTLRASLDPRGAALLRADR